MSKIFSHLKLLIGAILLSVIALLSSCYPNDNLSISETDVVMTGYYDSVDFTKLKTYYMSDTVYPVRDDTSDHSLIESNDLIIKTIADNMTAYGYTRITDTTEDVPDVRISSASITITTVSVGWWYPYYPGWGWGWGYGWKKSTSRDTDYYYPGYPGYYPPGYWWGYPYYSSYTTGTLLMEMANPLDYIVFEGDTVTPIYWASGINGVLSSGSDDNRIVSGINKAFELSPEIKTN
jgi:uncharacterized protein DUF4136